MPENGKDICRQKKQQNRHHAAETPFFHFHGLSVFYFQDGQLQEKDDDR